MSRARDLMSEVLLKQRVQRAAALADTLFRRSPLPNSSRSSLAPRFFLSGRLVALRHVWCRRLGFLWN